RTSTDSKDTRNVAGRGLQRVQPPTATHKKDVGCKCYQLGGGVSNAFGIAASPTRLDSQIAALHPAEPPQFSLKRRKAPVHFRIVSHGDLQHADPPHALGLLRPRRQRPRCRRAAEQRDELAAVHSITSSARASSVGGISNPMRLAVLRLITSSNFVDWMTGKSAGLAPLRMRPA